MKKNTYLVPVLVFAAQVLFCGKAEAAYSTIRIDNGTGAPLTLTYFSPDKSSGDWYSAPTQTIYPNNSGLAQPEDTEQQEFGFTYSLNNDTYCQYIFTTDSGITPKTINQKGHICCGDLHGDWTGYNSSAQIWTVPAGSSCYA